MAENRLDAKASRVLSGGEQESTCTLPRSA
jgi:hypothetical protein